MSATGLRATIPNEAVVNHLRNQVEEEYRIQPVSARGSKIRNAKPAVEKCTSHEVKAFDVGPPITGSTG